jgi:DnaJ domain
MNLDPSGHYAILDIDPAAPADAVATAFRRKALVLHPDVVGTGDTAGFLRLKEAYDVLSDPARRADYDRRAQQMEMERSAPPPVRPRPRPAPSRGPRLADLPIALWASIGGVFVLAVTMAVLQLDRSPPPARPRPPPAPPAVTASPPLPAAPLAPPAVPTHFVVPAGTEAVLWQHDSQRDDYVPRGQVPDFASVEALRDVPEHGLVQVRLGDGREGFVEASRLTPGDGDAARRAFCMYNAGAPPRNGEVLASRAVGASTLDVENHGGEAAVVKLRNAAGHAVFAIYVSAGGTLHIVDLPDQPYRLEFAVGEVWSRACGLFSVGMRAERLADATPVAALSPLIIPPELSSPQRPEDIADTDFARD